MNGREEGQGGCVQLNPLS